MVMTDRESEEVKALFGAWMSASASYIFEHSGDFSGDFKALHADAMRRGHALHVDADGMFRRGGYDRYCLEDDWATRTYHSTICPSCGLDPADDTTGCAPAPCRDPNHPLP